MYCSCPERHAMLRGAITVCPAASELVCVRAHMGCAFECVIARAIAILCCRQCHTVVRVGCGARLPLACHIVVAPTAPRLATHSGRIGSFCEPHH